MRARNRRGLRRLLSTITVFSSLTMLGAALFVTAGAQSQSMCSGDVVVEFASVRLRNVDGERTSGPHPVALAAGRYTVTAASFDDHEPGQPSQAYEQWRIRSDTGWVSPYTLDIPDSAQTTITTFLDQEIAAPTSTLTLEHRGRGGPNSVHPMCVGFRLTSTSCDSSSGIVASDGSGGAACDTGVSQPGGEQPGGEQPGGEQPGGEQPGGEQPGGEQPGGEQPGGEQPGGEQPGGEQPGGEQPGGEQPGVDSPGEPIEPEVKGKVETPTVLARTGAGASTNRVLGLALVFVGLGGLLRVWIRRDGYVLAEVTTPLFRGRP